MGGVEEEAVSNSQGFVTIDEEVGRERGSEQSSPEEDPWSRVGELPEGLGEKLLELREEGCVFVCVCVCAETGPRYSLSLQ